MKIIVLIGKKCVGKTTFANMLRYFLNLQLLENVKNAGMAQTEKFEYSYSYQSTTDEETGDVLKELVPEKTSLGMYGIEVPTDADKNYVCITSPAGAATIKATYGEDCLVVLVETFNNILRKFRCIGDGDFDSELFGVIDNAEWLEFKDAYCDMAKINRSELDLRGNGEIAAWLYGEDA